MFIKPLLISSLSLALSLPSLPAFAGEPVSLIPRTVLFGNPDRRAATISPDGKFLAWVAPHENVMNVFVAPINEPTNARVVTSDTKRGIRSYSWAYDGKHLIYRQDIGGDENWKVYAVDIAADKPVTRDLTPFEDIKGPDGQPIKLPSGQLMRPAAQIEAVSHKHPDLILIGLNNRDPQFHDIYSCELATGKLTLMLKNDGYAGFTFDEDFRPRLASKLNESGGNDMVKNVSSEDEPKWEPFASIAMEDANSTQPLGFDDSGEILYMTDLRGRNTAALKAINTRSGAVTTVAEDAKADAGGVMADPKTGKVQAVNFEFDRSKWKVVDPSIQPDLDALKLVADGELTVGSRTLDDSKWIAAYMLDNGPVKIYLYDRATKKATYLFSNSKALDSQPLVKMIPVIIKSRDGLDLVSYLSLPPGSDADNNGIPDQPVPMVLNVHGGPWARDSWGYNPTAQWLANRGYACLAVNFRSSTGMGKNFVNAGNREWAGKMHDDLIDAVNWAVDNKVAKKDKVAIMGGSYGGYATLVGLTFTPEVFACGVDIVGPSNITTLLNTIPPYWQPMIDLMTKQVGDHRTEEGRSFLASRSPLNFVDKITKPLLIGQGANDPRVKQSEADQIVSAMTGKGLPVTYVLYPDEGHGFQRPANRLSFFAITEQFLAQHLGGRAEPMGDSFKGSSVTVPTGAEFVPGLKDLINTK